MKECSWTAYALQMMISHLFTIIFLLYISMLFAAVYIPFQVVLNNHIHKYEWLSLG